jgi:hypothetical protein
LAYKVYEVIHEYLFKPNDHMSSFEFFFILTFVNLKVLFESWTDSILLVIKPTTIWTQRNINFTLGNSFETNRRISDKKRSKIYLLIENFW